MKFKEYMFAGDLPRLTEFNALLAAHDSAIWMRDVGAKYIAALGPTEMAAYRDATPDQGPFPLVMFVGGLDAPTGMSVVLPEFLASWGYIVATVRGLGPDDEHILPDTTRASLEAQIADLEFARSSMTSFPHTDAKRFAIIGHSWGGLLALGFAMRNPDVSAAVGLDASYAFPLLTTLITFPSYAPARIGAALLDVRAQRDFDLSIVRAALRSDRYLATLPRMRHSDFTSFGLIWPVLEGAGEPNASGRTNLTGAAGHLAVCNSVRAFLDAELKSDPSGINRVKSAVASIAGSTFTVLGGAREKR